MLVCKGVLDIGCAVIFVTVVHQMGFQLAVILGTADIIGVAVAVASQTSVSNIISGVFLIAEKPFHVVDIVKVAGTTGTVLPIDRAEAGGVLRCLIATKMCRVTCR